MLEDVQPVVRERGIEQRRNVPGEHRAHAEQPGDRAAGRVTRSRLLSRAVHAAANQRGVPSSKQRRYHQREQEMLDDMRAEEVLIAERIDGRDQIEKQQHHAGQEIRRATEAVLAH